VYYVVGILTYFISEVLYRSENVPVQFWFWYSRSRFVENIGYWCSFGADIGVLYMLTYSRTLTMYQCSFGFGADIGALYTIKKFTIKLC
jgi:hypothetical protein